MPAPQYCPTPRELDDLELLLSGALAPLSNFGASLGDVSDPGVTLALPPELADAPEIELVDPEGLPLALWTPQGLTPLSTPTYGPFRRLHLTPTQVRELYAGSLTVPVAAPLTDQDLELVGREQGGATSYSSRSTALAPPSTSHRSVWSAPPSPQPPF